MSLEIWLQMLIKVNKHADSEYHLNISHMDICCCCCLYKVHKSVEIKNESRDSLTTTKWRD